MPTRAADIEELVAAEISRISQPELVVRIKDLLVPVRCESRDWDYGAVDEVFPCWVFGEHLASNTAFAYCESGFGPSYPWGLLSIGGARNSIGPDGGWFASLEDLFRVSAAWEGTNPPGYAVA